MKGRQILVEHGGRMLTLRELGRVVGLTYIVLSHRYHIGKRGAELVAPVRPYRKPVVAPEPRSRGFKMGSLDLFPNPEKMRADQAFRDSRVAQLLISAAYPRRKVGV